MSYFGRNYVNDVGGTLCNTNVFGMGKSALAGAAVAMLGLDNTLVGLSPMLTPAVHYAVGGIVADVTCKGLRIEVADMPLSAVMGYAGGKAWNAFGPRWAQFNIDGR